MNNHILESLILFTVSGAAMIFSVVLAKHARSDYFKEPRRRKWVNLLAAALSAGVMLLVPHMISGKVHCVSSAACWVSIGAVTVLAFEQGRRAIWQTHLFKLDQEKRRRVPEFLYKH